MSGSALRAIRPSSALPTTPRNLSATSSTLKSPRRARNLTKGDEAVNIESVKVAEAVYAPVSGTVKDVNGDLEDSPELINKDAYEAFIYSIAMSDPLELDDLMDAAAYKAFRRRPGLIFHDNRRA